ncbi:MAG: hypothetical protein ACK2UW_04095 [Anaerolineales bacterium]|jgi:hypothetical protein
MVTIFGQHGVSDYEKWKKAFDLIARDWFGQLGIVSTKVYRTLDGQSVIVMHTFNSLREARQHQQLMESADMRKRAGEIGVKLPVTYWIVEEV